MWLRTADISVLVLEYVCGLGMMVRAWTPSTWEVEAGDNGGRGQAFFLVLDIQSSDLHNLNG